MLGSFSSNSASCAQIIIPCWICCAAMYEPLQYYFSGACAPCAPVVPLPITITIFVGYLFIIIIGCLGAVFIMMTSLIGKYSLGYWNLSYNFHVSAIARFHLGGGKVFILVLVDTV